MVVKLFIGAIYILGLVSFVSVTYDIIVNLYEKVKTGKEKRKMENYIVLNGVKLELTEEQVNLLTKKEEEKQDVIHRVECGELYAFCASTYEVEENADLNDKIDNHRFEKGNYYPPECEDIATQDMLHDELRSRLRKFTRNHGWDEALWNDIGINKYAIAAELSKDGDAVITEVGSFAPDGLRLIKTNDIFFVSVEIAEKAIKEVVEPFVEKHPEFVW